MKKRVIIAILILSSLFAFIQFSNAIFTPTTPSSCSDSAISSTWDSIFRTSSSEITIINGTSSTKCDQFIAYKINGNVTMILAGYDAPSYANKTTFYSAVEGNLSSEFQNTLSSASVNDMSSLLNPSDLAPYTYISSINSIAEANTSFNSIFKAENASWDSSGSGQSLYYGFSTSESNSSSTTTVNARVYNYSLSYLTFNRTLNITSSSCTPNWTAISASCNSNEYKTMWYNDTSNCNSTSEKPDNETTSCDFNGNGLIGNFSSFTETNIDLEIYVNDTLGNNSKNYTGTQKIDFRDSEDVTRLTFNYSFDSPLDLRGIDIEVQDSDSNYGYIVIHGLNLSKIVWINKLNSSSSSVCVKNYEGSVGSVSDYCNASREYLVNCPGEENNMECDIDGDYFVVSGITRSIIKEYLNDITERITCTNNWSCTVWSECSSGQRIRICTDKSYCGNNLGKPATTETCSVNACSANWDCTEWKPEKCPSNSTQTRTCKDLNSCNITSSKPQTVQSCEIEEKDWKPIIIVASIVAVIIILIIIVIIIIMKLKRNKGDSGYVNIQGMNYPRSPPGFPPSGYTPLSARPIARPMPMQPQPRPMPQPQSPSPLPGVPFGA